MSRLIWMGVGAAGGIYAYRHGQRVMERARERGVAGNTAAVTRTLANVYRGIRDAERDDLMDLTTQSTTVRISDAPAAPEIIDPVAGPDAPPAKTAKTGAASPVRLLRRRAS